ncbi:MAG: class I SAM-dependent methyltransferase [Gemmatimonadales bacterium]
MPGPAPSRDRALHWNDAYRSKGSAGVSWFQSTPTVSLELIEALEVPHGAAVIDIGGGSSSLVDHLVQRGFTDVSVLDLSDVALDEARGRLGPDAPVSWWCEDVLLWTPPRRYDVWHDRAVFHFLTNGADRDTYLRTVTSAIRPGGALVMATFAEDGPDHCSGLPVARYSTARLSALLGDAFEVVAERREVHTTPAGVAQPFSWIAARATQ